MKRIGKTLFLSMAMASIIGVAMINTVDSSDKLVQFIAPQAYPNVIHVSNWEDFKIAIEQEGSDSRTIILDEDIDLSGFTPADTANLVSVYPLEIDGNGHSFYNKPEEYFFTPLIDPIDDLEHGISKLYVHNLTFDNAGYLFENDTGVSPGDFETGGVNVSETNSLYFQDITLKNIDLSGQTWDANNSIYGLLFGDITLYSSGNPYYDNALTLSDITIENNTIVNNTINLVDAQSTFSFSPLGNLTYKVCLTQDHHHQGFVELNNIQIKNNKFMNNTINPTNPSLIFSYGNIFGSFNGLEDWTGTDGNFLNVSNILIQNNIIENPNGILSENFNYSEVISQPIATSNQSTKVNTLENVYSINNIIISDIETKNLYDQEDITIINMLDEGTNDWSSNASNSMMFIGPNYNNPEESINIVAGETGSELNDIYHAQTLTTSQLKYSTLNSELSNSLGIYSYDLTTRLGSQINEEFSQYGLNLNPTDRYLTKINLSSTQDQAIIYNASVDKTDNLVNDIQVDFKYLQANSLSNAPVTTPYVLSNVTLLEGTQALATDNQDLTTTSQNNFIYSANFEWVNGLNISTIDTNNLYLSFEYEDATTKTVQHASIKINSSEIFDFSVTNVEKTSGNTTTIIASISSIVLFIVLLIFLIFFIIWYRKRRQVAKVTGVQDGYLEYIEDNYNETTTKSFDHLNSFDQKNNYYNQAEDNKDYYEQDLAIDYLAQTLEIEFYGKESDIDYLDQIETNQFYSESKNEFHEKLLFEEEIDDHHEYDEDNYY